MSDTPLLSFSEFVDHYVPELRSIKQSDALLEMVQEFSVIPKHRRHSAVDGAFFMSNAEIRRRLGKDYRAVLEASQLIEICGSYSEADKTSFPYRLTRRGESLWFGYSVHRLLDMPKLTVVRGKTSAIRSRDRRDPPKVRKTTVQLKSFVHVNYSHVLIIYAQLTAKHVPPIRQTVAGLLDLSYPAGLNPEQLARWIKVRRNSLVNLMGKLCLEPKSKRVGLYQYYVESRSGRLYAEGPSLQNLPREIRRALLHLQFEYDFDNCHWAITRSFANELGIDTPAIDAYVANKKVVRHQLMRDLGLPMKEVKEALLMKIYGAEMRTSGRSSLGALLGDKAKSMIEHPTYRALSDEIRRLRRRIIDANTVLH